MRRACERHLMRGLSFTMEQTNELPELFVRSARGDRGAFDEVVERTSAPLYRLALRILANPADADESLQETFIRAHRALRAGQWQDGSKTYPWLITIVTRVCMDVLRRRRGQAVPVAELDASWLSSDGQHAERVGRVRELLSYMEELPPDQRAALVLRYIEGLSNAEVAAALTISEGAVEQRLIRARGSFTTENSVTMEPDAFESTPDEQSDPVILRLMELKAATLHARPNPRLRQRLSSRLTQRTFRHQLTVALCGASVLASVSLALWWEADAQFAQARMSALFADGEGVEP